MVLSLVRAGPSAAWRSKSECWMRVTFSAQVSARSAPRSWWFSATFFAVGIRLAMSCSTPFCKAAKETASAFGRDSLNSLASEVKIAAESGLNCFSQPLARFEQMMLCFRGVRSGIFGCSCFGFGVSAVCGFWSSRNCERNAPQIGQVHFSGRSPNAVCFAMWFFSSPASSS